VRHGGKNGWPTDSDTTAEQVKKIFIAPETGKTQQKKNSCLK